MDDRPPQDLALLNLAITVLAYLGFALSAGLSVRADGSARWPVLATGVLLLLLATGSLIMGTVRRHRPR